MNEISSFLRFSHLTITVVLPKFTQLFIGDGDKCLNTANIVELTCTRIIVKEILIFFKKEGIQLTFHQKKNIK